MKINNKFPRVSYGKSVHGSEEIAKVINVLKTSTQMGENVKNFENKIAKLFDKKYALMTNSGSSALLIAMDILNFKKGSEIITPVLTFGTTISSLLKANYKPIFVDVEKNTFCINIKQIESKITKKTKAILAPDLLGNICDWNSIRKIANKYNLTVIHDSADTLGAKLNNRNVGYFTDISITSFYGSHVINGAGNGGMLCLNDKKMFLKSKLLRSWGRSSSLLEDSENIKDRFSIKINKYYYDKKFLFETPGYQLEPSELSAAFALVQLKKLNKFIKIRQSIFKKHVKFFEKYSKYIELPVQNKKANTAWLAFPMLVKKNKYFNRTDIQKFLENRNIQTRVIFTGNILKQPGFSYLKKGLNNKNFSIADNVMERGLMIALHHGLTKTQLNHIYKSLDLFFSKYTK